MAQGFVASERRWLCRCLISYWMNPTAHAHVGMSVHRGHSIAVNVWSIQMICTRMKRCKIDWREDGNEANAGILEGETSLR